MTKLQNLFSNFFKSQTVKTSLLTILFVAVTAPLFAQSLDVANMGVYYHDGAYADNDATGTTVAQDRALYCNGWLNGTQLQAWPNPNDTANVDDRSFIVSAGDQVNPNSNATQNDPWVSSALIEYDQPYPSPTVANNYPNHCLGLCASFSCTNFPIGQSTYSIAFPIQRVTFDIFKYYNGKNPKSADETPTIRSIDVYPLAEATLQGSSQQDVFCGSYHCINAGKDSTTATATCVGADYVCPSGAETANVTCYKKFSNETISSSSCLNRQSAGNSNCIVFDGNGMRSLGDKSGGTNNKTQLNVCAGWDGFYEIAGEFGKSNGDFGYRATAYTNVPSDGIIADRIELETPAVYPGFKGATQIPIQIDVTNVHTVRSTPSLVGSITPVSAQPYTFTYRLSKDADVRIAIFDASTLDSAAYGDGSNSSTNGSNGNGNGNGSTEPTVETVQVTLESVCESPLGGSWSMPYCRFTSGSYATQGTCENIGGEWQSVTGSAMDPYTESDCQALGGMLRNKTPDGHELAKSTCAFSFADILDCDQAGGTWYGDIADPMLDIDENCYVDNINEYLCLNNPNGFTYIWKDGDGCYYPVGTPYCQLGTVTQPVCNDLPDGTSGTSTITYQWNGVRCEKTTTTPATNTGNGTGTGTGTGSGSVEYNNSFANGGDAAAATKVIVRTLVDWQPRTGEGMKGQEKDTQISDFDSWDGRHDEGFLLPAGNYLASIQAKSQDEWPGIDFSRAVTRQVSLDPLKLTDIQVVGLNKKSTAYATISFVPTEPSTVYWEVYTPGTVFAGPNGVSEILTDSSKPAGTSPTITSGTNGVTGSLVYRSVEQKTGRMNYTQRWDGTCQALDADGNPANCTRVYAKNERMSNGSICNDNRCSETFAYGAPMPDGNYVYVLWAEIPYNGKYLNAVGASDGVPVFTAGATCSGTGREVNNQCFTGVKTLKYTVGTLELERGLVGITMQPVGYATLGSSPTAYGLDPFIFKYALDRDAQVIATVENTAGVVVKHITLQEGEPSVAQQMNTLTWDGRDNQGRMVYPGTYMFRVKAMDAMFPAQSNEAIVVFPVDMYRVVDVATTDVYGDSNAKATISYHLSKTMNAQINIYNKDIVIPDYNSLTGEYNGAKVTATYTGKLTGQTSLSGVTITPTGGTAVTSGVIPENGSVVTYEECGSNKCRNTWTSASEYDIEGNRDLNDDLNNLDADASSSDHNNETLTGTYTIYLKQEVLDVTTDVTAAWPPRICNQDDDDDVMTDGYVDPALVNQKQRACIYINDKTFTNYPTDANQAASGAIDVRLQPIHTINRSKLSNGDDVINMEEWDALYFYNPNPDSGRHTEAEINKCKGQNEKANCPYEMLPDGQYPFFLSARSNEPFNRYYYDALRDDGKTFGSNHTYTISGEPFRRGVESNNVDNIDVQQEDYLYASDKVVSKINVTRGPVYFLDGSVAVFANAPQLFNAASTTLTFIPPYEINFSISRAAQVEVAIVALEPNMCSPVTDNVLSSNVNVYESRTNVAGDICKFLSTMTIRNTGHFDANAIRKIYWDGTDHTGNYVKPGIYEVRLTARNYPDTGLYDPTVKSITLNADLLKVFDLLENDNYAISQRGQNMKIGYQVSVPMKVAIQIFKPGTTIYDYSKGTLRNPTTGKEVQDIREVLVRSIVGIRPGTTLVEEVWDGLDYAGQEVPDGIYPFRFVTSLDTAAIDSVTGEILFGDDNSTEPNKWKIARVADTYEYQNLHRATIAIGDGQFVCEDWKKTVFFYPNPLNDASKGTLEITKMPVPGTVSIKYFNLAGDLVRDADYTCVDANNYQTTMGSSFYFQPDNNISTTRLTEDELQGSLRNVRNAALRCKWDRTNQHGKKVARGVYFGLIDFKAYNGREHCQKVVKILIP